MHTNRLVRAASAACAASLAALAAATICVAAAAQVALSASRDARVLRPNEAIERDLAPGQQHRYRLAVDAGECVHLIVEQRGIDVAVQTRAPEADALIAEVQDEPAPHGQEEIDLVADSAGTYTIVVAPAAGIVGQGSYAIRVAGRRAATAADRSRHDVRRLRTIAAQQSEQDDFASAAALLEQALALTEARGSEDREVADVAAQLADVYLDKRDTGRAEPLYLRALAIMDETLGPEHPTPAYVRARLARLYQLTDQRPKAEGLMLQALAVLEKTPGQDSLLYERALTTSQALRENARDFEQAGQIIRRQLAILEKLGYTESVEYAQTLTALGGVYNMQRDARAEDILRRALAVCEALRGRTDTNCDHNTLSNLGVFAKDHGDFLAAEAYYKRSLASRTPVVGADSADLIPLLNNLANTYHSLGDDARALDMHFQALRSEERSLGPYHRYALLTAGNIAIINTVAGDLPTAIAFQRRADAILEKQLALNLAAGSERQKLSFVRAASERTDRTISLHLHEAPDDPDAAALAALVVLQRKGRVLDAMTDLLAAARQRARDTNDQPLLDQLDATTAQLARFALNTPEGTTPEARQAQIRNLEEQKERLEAEIGAHDAEFRAQTQPVTLQAVQDAIPRGAALVEFAVFRAFDPRPERYEDAYGPPHYAAYVIRRDAAPRGFDLGPAKPIDEAITALRGALRDPSRRDFRKRARAVAEQVMGPLQAAIGEERRLLVSPDGDLNLVPFDALIDARGRYLVERYAITYLTSGRDLLRMQVSRESRSAAVILADPLFGEPAPTGATPASAGRASARRSSTTAEDLSAVYFAPLPATEAEGRAIKRLFPAATLFTGSAATKEALRRAEAPHMLHIASHGFFLHEPIDDKSASWSAGAPVGGRGIRAAVTVENPLLRSGLALAGANLTRDSNNDGILTALEASSLNLWGTKLVTLSGCDTGVGEVRNGEGVYGLRRAFVLAGAETLVLSLWPVSDYLTRQMMTTYYTGLRAGLGRGDALRRAKLAMLTRQGLQHPFYWAGFIQSGEWANLDGQRASSTR